MYVNAPGYHAVHLYEISGPGHFALKQRYGFNEMPMGTIKTGGFSVGSGVRSFTKTSRGRLYTTRKGTGGEAASRSAQTVGSHDDTEHGHWVKRTVQL